MKRLRSLLRDLAAHALDALRRRPVPVVHVLVGDERDAEIGCGDYRPNDRVSVLPRMATCPECRVINRIRAMAGRRGQA